MHSNDAGQPPGANPFPRPQRTSRQRARRVPERLLCEDGEEIILVSGRKGQLFQADAADFDRLMALGVSDQWFTHGNGKGNIYVQAQVYRAGKGRPETIARLILDLGWGKNVRYRDGNPCNLCRSNLYTEKGYAKNAPKLDSPGEGTAE